MDTVKVAGVCGILFACGWLVLNFPQAPKVREYPAYCTDPFATYDMGVQTFTPCAAVPMWSMKV